MTKNIFQRRRLYLLASVVLILLVILIQIPPKNYAEFWQKLNRFIGYDLNSAKFSINQPAIDLLNKLEVKGRAPKTGYKRDNFSDGWAITDGCDTRNKILQRDLKNVVTDQKCKVVSGVLNDLYTGKTINYRRGKNTSGAVQIDHIVAVSDAWQKGAQQLTPQERRAFYNDSDNLLAVDGPANQQKGDADAASWLPPNKLFRCDYVSRQIKIKAKYRLWVTEAEKEAMSRELRKCPITN